METTQNNEPSRDALAHWLAMARHTPLALVCDLDGTLLHFSATPTESALSPRLVELLNELTRQTGMHLVIVSGRLRDQLESIFLPVPGAWLVAEHGAWRRQQGAWVNAVNLDNDATTQLADLLEASVGRVAGAMVERKSWSVAFHYRRVPQVAREAVHVELDALVDEWLHQHPGYERLEGNQVLEIRPARVRKSLAIAWLREHLGPEARLVAMGDDLTDEDMFRELGVNDDAVLVGPSRQSRARWRLPNPDGAAALLDWILAARSGATSDAAPLPERLVARPVHFDGTATAHGLLVVSNRLPAIRQDTSEQNERRRSVGGLVAALGPALEARRGLWLGWSGRTLDDDQLRTVDLDETSSPALAQIDFPNVWYEEYYNGFSNRVLWPLFHTFPRYLKFIDSEWENYGQANRAFAEAAVRLVAPDTPIWVHDYHLLLVGRELRRLGHRGPIGFFLHIPFPGTDLFEMLPWAEQILDAMLDYSLIGFHTERDATNFRHTVSILSPARVAGDIEHRGRRVHVGVFPIGTMPETFQEVAEAEAAQEIAALLQSIAPSRLILGVDRLDYTKGIPERLEAFALLLNRYPHWRGRISLVQISVPSRADVPEYREQRRRIENTVGRINGEYGEASWVPIRYLYRSYSPGQLAEFYRAADVGYVTPLRDGMNLVAKEYVAAQNPDDPGVLVLSRFAGAAAELSDAVLTNPWHAEGVARDLDRALNMGLAERQDRHRRLLAAVLRSTATTWAESFLQALLAAG